MARQPLGLSGPCYPLFLYLIPFLINLLIGNREDRLSSGGYEAMSRINYFQFPFLAG